MRISGNCVGLDTRAIALKNGPRAGQTSYAYSTQINGVKVDLGFKKMLQPNRFYELEVEDMPKYGSHKLVSIIQDKETQPDNGPTPVTPSVSNSPSKGSSMNVKPFPIPKTHGDTSICRQNALTNAINFLMHTNPTATVDQVLKTAYLFSKWTTGQMEAEEAEKILSELAQSQDGN